MGCSCFFPISRKAPFDEPQNCIIMDCAVRVRFEELYSDEKFKEIINFEEIKKGELYVNIIYYDKDIRKEENMKYYRYFSIDTIGGYYPFDDFEMIKLFITKLNEMSYKCSYIIIISGKKRN